MTPMVSGPRSDSAPKQRHRTRWGRVALWLFATFALVIAAGFLAVPPLLKAKLETTLSAALQRDVRVGGVAFNPFTLTATLSQIAVADRGAGTKLLTVEQLELNGEISSLFRLAPVVSAVRVVRPELRLIRQPDRRYNISDLIDAWLAAPPGPPPRFSISNIEVTDGRVDFDDQPERRQHAVTDIRLGIPFVSSLPSNVEINVQPAFSARVNGRPVAIAGETRPFEDTHATTLRVDLDALALPEYAQYTPTPLPFVVGSGRLDAKIVMVFATPAGKPPVVEASGSLGIHDLALTERGGGALVSVPSLRVALDKFDMNGNSLELGSIALDGPDVTLRRSRDGALNLAALSPGPSAPSAAAPAAAPPFRFHVGEVTLGKGTLRFTDEAVAPAYRSKLVDVALTIRNLGNAPNSKARVDLAFATDAGEKVAHRGSIQLAPLTADGHLQVQGLDLKRLYPYYQSALNLEVDAGTLDLATEVRVAAADPAGPLTLSGLDGTLSALKLRLPDEREVLWRVPTLAVRGGAVDVAKRKVSLGEVTGKGAVAIVRRDPDGSFNFARLIRTQEAGTPAPNVDDTWRVDAHTVALEDFAIAYTDNTVSPAARMALNRISVKGEDLSNIAGQKGRINIRAAVNQRGTLALSGPLGTAPLAGTLSVTAKNVDLVPLQPYLTKAAQLIVTAGLASAQGTLDFTTADRGRAAFKGELGIADLALLDEGNSSDLVRWKLLQLGGIDARTEPLAVSINEIAIDSFYARVLLNENGELNLQRLAQVEAPAKPDAAKPGVAQPDAAKSAATTKRGPAAVADNAAGTTAVNLPPARGGALSWLKLGKVTLSGGDIDFTDHFIRPNYSAHLTGLAGGLSTLALDTPAEVELRGSVDNTAPLEIVGRINPLAQDLYLDLKANARDIELSPLSPYSGKYAGYGIQRGKLSVEVRYLVENRKLSAENHLVLDQLTFGDKVDSPDAIKVPLLLAVALLKDRNGVIDIRLPISGSLDDPHFSVGGIVIQAIIGLLTKIITAPFAVLASLGGGKQELAYVEFAPGSAALDAAGEAKLRTLGKALIDRPALKLDVVGRDDPVADRAGLQRGTLDRKIRQQKFNDLVKQGQPPASVDDIQVVATEYPALLARVYRAEDVPTKPRNAIGLAKDVPSDEMEKLLLAHFTADDEALRQLAGARAQRAKSYLVDVVQVPAERVFLATPKLGAIETKDAAPPTRVDFALR